jgi:hypothetical protein
MPPSLVDLGNFIVSPVPGDRNPLATDYGYTIRQNAAAVKICRLVSGGACPGERQVQKQRS